MPDNPRRQAADAKAVVDRFISHQRAMYAGGGIEPVADLLADDIVWHVPGRSPIAGDHRGRDAVIAYFETRRRLDDSLGAHRRLTVAAVDVNYLGPVRADDDLRIGVSFDRVTTRSIQVHYDAFVEDSPVARARARYVCLDVASGLPTPLPASVSGHAPWG